MSSSSSRFSEMLQNWHRRHERLKHAVHTKFRYPLPPWGRAVMGFIYFSIPVVGGWHIMQWAISKSHASIGELGERLPNKTIQGIGDQAPVRSSDDNGEDDTPKSSSSMQKVGAGGWGGGVRLAVSDEETQQKNRQMLDKFLRRERRKLQREQAQAAAEKEQKLLLAATQKEKEEAATTS